MWPDSASTRPWGNLGQLAILAKLEQPPDGFAVVVLDRESIKEVAAEDWKRGDSIGWAGHQGIGVDQSLVVDVHRFPL